MQALVSLFNALGGGWQDSGSQGVAIAATPPTGSRYPNPCAYRELNPAVSMMKSAEDRLSSEFDEPLDRPMARGILTQGQMRLELVVLAGVGRKDLGQMGLAEDDNVIVAFPADRADQPLRHCHVVREVAVPVATR